MAGLLKNPGGVFVFEEPPVSWPKTDDVDRHSLERYFGSRTSIPWVDLLRNTGVAVLDDEGVERPTVAGVLAFAKAPTDHLPSAFIEAAVYRTDRLSSDDLIHADQIKGRVDEQIDQATAFVDRFMLRPATKPVGRQDHPQYTIGAVHEAVVNAVAHRDYSISGSKIRLFLFADRLELYSPGALPNTVTIETMPYRVFTRNQLLVGFLSKMRI